MKLICKRLLLQWTGLDVVFKLQDNLKEPKADSYILKAAEHYKVKSSLMTKLPSIEPSTVFLCTHHTGAVDILGLYPFLRKATVDLKIVVNQQLMAISVLQPIFIPVMPPSYRFDNRNGLEYMAEHLQYGGNILLYPAGKIGVKKDGVIQDLPWQWGSVPLLRNHAKRIIPVLVDAENKSWFYFLRRFFPRISQALILRALIDCPSQDARIYFGNPIVPTELSTLDDVTFMQFLREATYNLKPQDTVATKESACLKTILSN